jgi:hypothetical protein
VTVDLLESAVAPGIEDPAARRTMWICIGLLDNLVDRIEDRQSIQAHECDLLRSLVDQPTLVVLPPDEPAASPSLAQLRAALAVRLRRIPWRGSAPQSAVTRDWLCRSRAVLTAINDAEIALLRSTRFGIANGSAGEYAESGVTGDDDAGR